MLEEVIRIATALENSRARQGCVDSETADRSVALLTLDKSVAQYGARDGATRRDLAGMHCDKSTDGREVSTLNNGDCL